MDSKKSRLNLPAGMEASLRLDPAPSHFPVLPKTPSPSKTTYSDRFIPCRSSSRLQNFALIDTMSSPVKEGGNELYSRLLRTELFGSDSLPGSPAGQGSPISPSKNLFRYKMDHSAPSSPLSVSGVDGGALGESNTMPPKVPRKIPKTAHKVLDAPSLQDDFYLNLVDWSSQNTLAVGLGTCVYLWNASTSKVLSFLPPHHLFF